MGGEANPPRTKNVPQPFTFTTMITGWNPSQQQLTAKYAQFAAGHVAPFAAQHDANSTFPQQAWDTLTETGFWQDCAPQADADSCWNFLAALQGLAATAKDSGFVLSVIAHAALIRAIHIHGTPTQKTTYLPLLHRGELTATAIAEPHSGTDVPGIKTLAIAQGQAYLLNGEKTNIAHAPTASNALIVGRIPALGKKDITLFWCNTQQQGYTRSKQDDKLGNRSLPTGSIVLKDYPLDSTAILGTPGEGLNILRTIAGTARVAYALAAAHLLTPVLKHTLTWVRARSSNGKTLDQYQYVQQKLTDAKLGMEASHWLALGAMHQLLQDEATGIAASSSAKLQACTHFRRGAEAIVGVQGSIGYQRGDAERLLRDAIGWMHVGGTEELHRMAIWARM